MNKYEIACNSKLKSYNPSGDACKLDTNAAQVGDNQWGFGMVVKDGEGSILVAWDPEWLKS